MKFGNKNIYLNIVNIDYELTIGKKNLLKVLEQDFKNSDVEQGQDEKPSLGEILEKIEGVSEVDYHGMFKENAIYFTIDNSINTIAFREKIVKKIYDYIKQ